MGRGISSTSPMFSSSERGGILDEVACKQVSCSISVVSSRVALINATSFYFLNVCCMFSVSQVFLVGWKQGVSFIVC